MRIFALFFTALAFASAVWADSPSLERGSVFEAATKLKAGEYLWAGEVAPRGPVLMVISLATQRAVLYRNGVPVGITTVSTGRPGYRTPTGVFTVLQKRVEHYSSLYDDAPMPYMQRLTWGGVALHAGHLPGRPASHGCIRLPLAFARLLYGATHVGMTVVITNEAAVPRIAPAAALLGRDGPAGPGPEGATDWHPERSATGPLSILVSAADARLVVLRNGIVIGSAPATLSVPIGRTTAYILQASAEGERQWLRIPLPGQQAGADDGPALRGHVGVDEAFRARLEPLLEPGTTVIVTADSLRTGGAGRPLTLIEADEAPRS